jgi:hypothetical protein
MSPTEVIKRAAGDGVLLAFSASGSISARGNRSAVNRWLPAIRQHKAALLELLRPAEDGWSSQDWQAFFEERAGIAESDGGLLRAEAEARAFDWCVAEWLNRNPAHSPPGRCFGCGRDEASHNPVLPIGVGSRGKVWLHSGCSSAWYTARKAEAIAALAAMGISAAGIGTVNVVPDRSDTTKNRAVSVGFD